MSWCCEICGESEGRPFQAREMMNGLRRPFRYIECQTCGCVQIEAVPEDIGEYYAGHYYSFRPEAGNSTIRDIAQQAPLYLASHLPRRLRDLAFTRLPWYRLGFNNPSLHTALATANVAARILDVGAGAGRLVRTLRRMGFRNAIGIDPFLDQDIRQGGQVLVRKQDLFEVQERYDLICLHHSLEHMTGQIRVLARIRELLAPGGRALIRIPLVGGEAWREYGPDWIQLDPPRHLVVQSRDSFERSARDAGFVIEKLTYDSSSFQFSGSELYRRDIPFFEASRPMVSGEELVFSAAEMRAFDERAQKANAAMDGDQIEAILRPAA